MSQNLNKDDRETIKTAVGRLIELSARNELPEQQALNGIRSVTDHYIEQHPYTVLASLAIAIDVVGEEPHMVRSLMRQFNAKADQVFQKDPLRALGIMRELVEKHSFTHLTREIVDRKLHIYRNQLDPEKVPLVRFEATQIWRKDGKAEPLRPPFSPSLVIMSAGINLN